MPIYVEVSKRLSYPPRHESYPPLSRLGFSHAGHPERQRKEKEGRRLSLPFH